MLWPSHRVSLCTQEVFGTKRMLLAEVWVFIFGNIIAGTAHNMNQLVAGRLLAGVGGAGLMSLCTIIVSREDPILLRPTIVILNRMVYRAYSRETAKLLLEPHQRRVYHRRLRGANSWWRPRKIRQLAMDVSSHPCFP